MTLDEEKALEIIFNKMFDLRPVGEKDEAFFFFRGAVVKDEIEPNGLVSKYKEYVESLLEFQNGKYTHKEHRIFNPSDWLEKKMWTRKIVKPYDPKDFYLYGI